MTDNTQAQAPKEPEVSAGLTTAELANSDPAETRTFAAGRREEPVMDDDADRAAPLFPGNEVSDLRGRWDAIQASFVDEPRKAVDDADSLVAGAMKRLAEMFADERGALERQWDRGEDVSTEDLRQAFRRYRTFFSRLLSI